MRDEHSAARHKGINPWFIVGLILAVVGVALALTVERDELAPGCRHIGKFQHCETPAPSPSSPKPGDVRDRYSPPYEDDPMFDSPSAATP